MGLSLREPQPPPPKDDGKSGINNILALNSDSSSKPGQTNAISMYKEFMEEEKKKEEDRIERRRKTERHQAPNAPEVAISGWEKMTHREREDALVRSRKENEERFMYVNRRGGGMPVSLPGHNWRPG